MGLLGFPVVFPPVRSMDEGQLSKSHRDLPIKPIPQTGEEVQKTSAWGFVCSETETRIVRMVNRWSCLRKWNDRHLLDCKIPNSHGPVIFSDLAIILWKELPRLLLSEHLQSKKCCLSDECNESESAQRVAPGHLSGDTFHRNDH